MKKNKSEKPYIAIGIDSRTSGEALFHAAASGIMSVGVDVVCVYFLFNFVVVDVFLIGFLEYFL